MTETTVAYKAVMNRMGIYIQETQIDEYLAAGYTVYKITTEVLEVSEDGTTDAADTSGAEESGDE